MSPRKRHRWINNRCLDCNMIRLQVQARSQRGCFGTQHFMRTIYRNSVGRQVYVHGKPNAVPPCVIP